MDPYGRYLHKRSRVIRAGMDLGIGTYAPLIEKNNAYDTKPM